MIRLAALLVLLGLLVEGATLLWSHPLAFVAFVTLGGAFYGFGLLLYLRMLILDRGD